jgi:hypothetical protein
MFFLSKAGGPAFWLGLAVFALKFVVYTFLSTEAMQALAQPLAPDVMVMSAQFLMMPIAVMLQEDLLQTIFMVSNLKYDRDIEAENPHATKGKYTCALFLRAVDGCYSLLVNFAVLLTAENVLSVFLNFAALQFIQTIDNLSLDLATQGYLGDGLEAAAGASNEVKLKRNHNEFLRSLDSIIFVSLVLLLFLGWAIFHFVTRVSPDDDF